MIGRRAFNRIASAFLLSPFFVKGKAKNYISEPGNLVVSTWNNQMANSIAFDHLKEKPEELLNAIEQAINYVENDPKDTSVGYGGSPDSSGQMSLDACIMDHKANAGSVSFLKDIKNAVSVARKVMEETPHVMLVGQGAKDFALSQGFKEEDILSEEAERRYKKWLEKSVYEPKVNSERHDTIGLLAKNSISDLSGACSTSGLSFKMPGRVGDSPIIGSGLYVDNKIGAATATGYGELVLKSCSCFLVVELMRSGMDPVQACKEAIIRLIQKQNVTNKQVGLIAIDKQGRVGAYSVRKGFNYCVADSQGIRTIEADHIL